MISVINKAIYQKTTYYTLFNFILKCFFILFYFDGETWFCKFAQNQSD